MKRRLDGVEDGKGMATFLSTLVQTTATLMAILLAAIAAYFVFLQGKAADFDDKINFEKTVVRAQLARLQTQWPGGLDWLLPPEFNDRFSARTGNLHGVDLIDRYAAELTFPSDVMRSALNDVSKSDSFGPQHSEGRAYAVALALIVKSITQGVRLELSAYRLGKPEPPPAPPSAFPRSAVGPGFEQWRSDFERISIALRFLENREPFAVADFSAFCNSQPNFRDGNWKTVYANSVRAVFESVDGIRSRLRTIDELQLAQSLYSFRYRVHARTLLLLIIGAVLVGVIVPLFSMTGKVSELSSLAANAYLIATLVFVSAAFVQLGLDIFRPLRPDSALYLRDRWLRPLKEATDANIQRVEQWTPIDNSGIKSFLATEDSKQVPNELLVALKACAEGGEEYNAAAERFDAIALEHLQNDADFGRFRRPYREANKRQHPILSPSDLVSSARIEEILRNQLITSDVLLGVETQYSWGSRGRMALVAAPRNRNDLIDRIRTLSEKLQSVPESHQFTVTRTRLAASLRLVSEKLGATNRSVGN